MHAPGCFSLSARRLYALALVLGLLATGFLATAVYGADRGSAVMAAASSITGEELQEHVTFLADDAREGREAGTPGGKAAGDYLAEQFRRRGLRPAGDPGSYFQNFGSGYRNVLGCWEGGDPERAVEVILVGAHYDHIGYGAKRSRGQTGQVHNGADDNASGTSSLLELADALATLLPERPKRSILLAAWDAEEKGLLGSRHWVKSPTVPLEKVQIAINADMIGRLRQQRLAIYGTRSGFGLRRLLANANETVGLNLEFSWNVRSDSDHFAFFQQGIPALLLHTGMHADYHRPSDDPATLNPDGMQAVVRLMFFAVWELADRPGACTFREAARRESDQTRRALLASPYGRTGRLGVAWVQPAEPGLGVLLSAVEPGSPAEKAGLRPGDRIVEASGKPIGCPEDWIGAVLAAQGPLPLKVQRAEAQEPLVLSIELAGAPVRYGLIYRPDDAEPGAALVTCVVPGSAAALAGIQAGDYIHQIAGHPITDQRPFDELAASLPNPIELLVERDGKLLHLVLDPSGGKP